MQSERQNYYFWLPKQNSKEMKETGSQESICNIDKSWVSKHNSQLNSTRDALIQHLDLKLGVNDLGAYVLTLENLQDAL